MEETNHNGIIKMGVGVLLTILFISLALMMFNKSKPAMDKSANQIDSITRQMETVEFQAYNNTIVSGAEVISAINTKASDNITVTVNTNKATGTPYNGPTYNQTKVSASDYIEPSARFDAIVKRTDNQTIIGITFTQK